MDTDPRPIIWPDGLSDAQLPIYLALPLQEYLREDNPRVRLHWMLDTIEVAIRWTVAVAVAEIRADVGGGLPDAVKRSLHDHIERPTVGRWVGMLRTLSRSAPSHPLSPSTFALHDACIAPLFSADGSETESLLVLRNRVAHGGGMSSRKSAELLAAHDSRFLDLMRAIRGCTDGLLIQGRAGQEVVELRGAAVVAAADALSPIAEPEAAWLSDGQRVLSLSPLVTFAPVRVLGKDGQLITRSAEPVPQIYARSGPQSLSYTPLGRDEAHSERDEVDAFRSLFGLDEARAARKGRRREFAPTDFLREASDLAEGLIGRQTEVRTIKSWIKTCPTRAGGPRIGWLSAGPGIGKSMVLARVARDLGNSSHHALYYHRFSTGDVRNNRRMFLQLFQEALWAWAPLQARTGPPVSGDVEVLLEDVRDRLAQLASLAPPSPRAPPPCFRVLLDGVECIAAVDPDFLPMIHQLALPGSVWLLAGRPSPALTGADVHTLFAPDGLPPMCPGDIRSLLLEGLGHARYALLRRDEDDADDAHIHNAFVETVVARAEGLPLYVELLLDDLRSGFLTVQDEDKLPDGLSTYYEDLISRMGISDVQINLILLICMLARAEEPLDLMAIRFLLSTAADTGEDELIPEDAEHVTAVLRAGRSLLREATAASGERAYTLYHQGFREYITATPALQRTRRRAEGLLHQMADRWAELPAGNLRNHMFRWGTEYALWWGRRRGLAAARRRLTDFAYLSARTAALPSLENLDLAREYSDVRAALGEGDVEFTAWERFFQAHDHLLRRGSALWGSEKILLQVAMEYADSSPITQAAEAWMATAAPWLWLRRDRRPVHVALRATEAVFEGHARKIDGALLLPGDRALSWSMDTTARLWDLTAGSCLVVLEGHSKRLKGAAALPDDRAVTWSDDSTVRVWSLADGSEQHCLTGHSKPVESAVLLGAHLLTASRDKTARLWDLTAGACVGVFAGHKRWIKGLTALPDGRFLTWDRTVRLWTPDADKPLHILTGHTADVLGVLPLGALAVSWSRDGTARLWDLTDGSARAVLPSSSPVLGVIAADGVLLGWREDGSLALWDAEDGRPLGVLTGHTAAAAGAMALPGGRALSWAVDGELRTWDLQAVAPIATLRGHEGAVSAVVALPDDRLFVGSSRGPVSVWGAGHLLASLPGHSTTVEGMALLPDGRVLSWSSDRTLRCWSTDPALLARVAEIEAANASPDDHTDYVSGTKMLPDGRVLSWSRDKTLRLWGAREVTVLRGHTGAVEGARVLPDGRILSWSADCTLRIWADGVSVAVLLGHSKSIKGVRTQGDALLSFSSDGTLRLWSLADGAARAVLEGHRKLIKGARFLPDGRVLSWSSDSTLRLWSADGTPLATLEGHSRIIEGAALLPDGRVLSWSSDSTLRLWSADGTPLATLEGHAAKKSVKGAVVLRDGRILSWSNDKTLRLWSSQGAMLAVLVGHTGEVVFAAGLPDGGIISHARDNAFRLWTAAGEPAGVISAERAPLEWTAAWMVWKTARRAAWTCGVAVVDETPGGVRLLIADADGPVVVRWHGQRGRWFADAVTAAGGVVARDTARLYGLQLHHGLRPIDLDEAQRLIT